MTQISNMTDARAWAFEQVARRTPPRAASSAAYPGGVIPFSTAGWETPALQDLALEAEALVRWLYSGELPDKPIP